MNQPEVPSNREKEEHDLTHANYRSWCRHCVKGRGRTAQHRSTEGGKQVPTIAMDYCFPSQGDEKALKVIAIRDSGKKAVKALVVPQKGSGDGWIVKRIVNVIDSEWGKKKVILKSDKEASIRELKEKIRQMRIDDTIIEVSPKGDSQSNGAAENAVQVIEDMIRTWKSALDEQYKVTIKSDLPIVAWMVEYCGELINRYRTGEDGKTAYFRIKGKRSSANIVPFGEKVLFMPAKDKSQRKNLLEPRFIDGIWAGIDAGSGESIILTPSGVRKARTVKRLPEGERYDREFLTRVKGMPWEEGAIQDNEDTEIPTVETPKAQEETRPEEQEEHSVKQKRRWKITKNDIEAFGPTKGCLGCNCIIAG